MLPNINNEVKILYAIDHPNIIKAL